MKINRFDVLNRQLNIRKNYLLEASAGTGKTFSIENIVTRLLIEDDFITQQTTCLEQILVVTFTRAAARDLKLRIRSTLEKSLIILREQSQEGPDYLQAILEQGPQKITSAAQQLEQALAIFDQAHIYTIHGFCVRMLTQFVFESSFPMSAMGQEEKNLNHHDMHQIIRDFFRTQILPDIYSPAQLQILIKSHYTLEKVQEKLLKQLDKDCDMTAAPDFTSDLKTFQTIMHQLLNTHQLNPEKMRDDFDRQSEYYKPLKNKSFKSIYAFFDLFKKNEWGYEDLDNLVKEGLGICEFLASENAYKKKKIPDQLFLNYPQLLTLLEQTLKPLVERAQRVEFIFARMAHYCRIFVQKHIMEEEKYREDDLLKGMLKAVENPLFASKVRGLYHAAIIDEFQDTDPIQWEIFQKLFLNDEKKCLMYLVGDPKQSIYAFRQADIYTYLSAATKLGVEHQASLDTNYRSQPSLVKGLNILFQNCPQLFPLPALAQNQSLGYPPVKSSPHAAEKHFSDSLGNIHFFSAVVAAKANQKFPPEHSEEEFYFPFISQEIMRLHSLDRLNFKQFAVLIKDKFQARRLATFFNIYHIPFIMQRQTLLTESPAWDTLKELLMAVLHCKNENFMKIALGGRILGWNYNEIKALENIHLMEKITAEFFYLNKKLADDNFGSFFSHLMQSCWHADGLTVIENLLSQEGGDLFYDDLNQIATLLMEHQSEHPATPERLVTFLEESKSIPAEDDYRLKKFVDPNQDAVSILTIHNSKGLEYDIVFAYGLIGRPKAPSLLIPQRKEFSQCIVPCPSKDSDAYLAHCEELDAEKMRQLYVAMTRAKYRLYVPVATSFKAKSVDFGCASPMDIFLARLGKASCDYQELYQRMGQGDDSNLQKFIQDNPEGNFSHSLLNHAAFSLTQIKSKEQISELKLQQLVTPEPVIVPGERRFIQSFTSLSKLNKTPYENPTGQLPHDFNSLAKSPHTLPAGAATGKLLHKILEMIPFKEVQKCLSPASLAPWIQPFLKDSEFHDWEYVLCDVIFNVLKTPIGFHSFCLGEMDPLNLYREMEFLYPCEKQMSAEEMRWQNGFLKGVIDLICCFQDRYYIIDWKSNWLGPTLTHYSPEKMAFAMQQHDYFFQAHIYKEALKRYLKIVDKRPFEDIYGGCYYIFLRGLDSSSKQTTGVFHL